MLYNLNDVYKDKIYNRNVVEMYEYLNSLDEEKQELLLRFILIDYYKISSIGNKKETLNNYNIDSILMSCLDSAEVFSNIFKKAKLFHKFDYFSKSLLLEVIKKKGLDDRMTEISKTHLLDKLTYKIIDDLNLYQKYYIDHMAKNKGNLTEYNLTIDYLSLRILDLKYKDIKKYEKFMIEIIKVYYKWRKFINDHDGEYLLNDIDFIYMDRIEQLSKEELFNIIEEDAAFLNMIVCDYFHYKTEKIEIKEELVDKYLNESCNEKIKNKLKIKSQNDN